MNEKGFTFIEAVVSMVLISAVLYGVSMVPLELARLKSGITEGFRYDSDILTLKQTIDGEIINGGIIVEVNSIMIGSKVYPLTNIGSGKYSFDISDLDEKAIYYGDASGTSFFYLENSPDKELRYNNHFTSFGVVK